MGVFFYPWSITHTVQRAELWEVVLSRQAFVPVFIGIDNLNVFSFVSKLLEGSEWLKPLPLHRDGDLITYIQGTVKVAKAEGHALDEMVADGSVRWQDKDGNESAERDADLGRSRQTEHIMDARRQIQNAASFGYPIVCELHWFFIAVARTVVNSDGKRRLRA